MTSPKVGTRVLATPKFATEVLDPGTVSPDAATVVVIGYDLPSTTPAEPLTRIRTLSPVPRTGITPVTARVAGSKKNSGQVTFWVEVLVTTSQVMVSPAAGSKTYPLAGSTMENFVSRATPPSFDTVAVTGNALPACGVSVGTAVSAATSLQPTRCSVSSAQYPDPALSV